jgi:hypothetical protein
MESKELTNPQDLQIQGLIDRYLRSQVSSNDFTLREQHLDEDSLTAFTEGSLSEREVQPVVRHLVNCSYCRHVTTELIRLDLAFADDSTQVIAVENQPSKVSEVLSGLLSRIFGTNDGVVFAHQEKEENTEDKKK